MSVCSHPAISTGSLSVTGDYPLANPMAAADSIENDSSSLTPADLPTPAPPQTAARPGPGRAAVWGGAAAAALARAGSAIDVRLQAIFSLDLRSLACLRVGVGLLLLTDLLMRSQNIVSQYTDEGTLPRAAVLA